MYVRRPAQTLAALRAVGGDVEEIALLPPEDVMLKLAQQRVGAGELADALHARIEYKAGEVVQRGRAGEAVQPHVAEALIGEVRAEHGLAPGEYVFDALLRAL